MGSEGREKGELFLGAKKNPQGLEKVKELRKGSLNLWNLRKIMKMQLAEAI